MKSDSVLYKRMLFFKNNYNNRADYTIYGPKIIEALKHIIIKYLKPQFFVTSYKSLLNSI